MTPQLTRRRFLGTAAGATSFVVPAGANGSSDAQILRQLIVPEAAQFEGNYVGQFVFIEEAVDADVGDVPIESCEFDAWSPDETQVYEGELLDRRQEVPVAVELAIYADGDRPQIEPGTHFIIDDTSSCEGDYVGLEVEWVQRRALVGKPRGPTVTETGTGGQPGFGWVAAAAGVCVGVLARAIARRRNGERSKE